CPVIGISGSNSAPSLYQWEKLCPIFGVSERNSAPSLVSGGGIVPRHWFGWKD
ncbi:unnamed protein product, partial [Staurois parvus]